MAHDCREVAIILKQLKLKKSQSANTFHNERKMFLNRCSLSKAKGKTTSNHEVLGYMALLPFDVIGRFVSLGSGIIKIFLFQTVSPK